jgi:hypothetical protein
VSEERNLLFHRRQTPPSAKFFFAVMVPDREYHHAVEARIAERLGPLDLRSSLFLFSEFSPYYSQEMGLKIWKYFVAVREEIPMDRLREVKIFAEKLEIEWARVENAAETGGPAGAKRTVNLDPGYVTGWSVVLSTVKNRAHRVYLGEGIYAELTMLYRKGRYSRLPWTYPDYDTPLALEFFLRVRSSLQERLKGP